MYLENMYFSCEMCFNYLLLVIVNFRFPMLGVFVSEFILFSFLYHMISGDGLPLKLQFKRILSPGSKGSDSPSFKFASFE